MSAACRKTGEEGAKNHRSVRTLGRLDAELPAGAVRLVVRGREGGTVDTLCAASDPLPGPELFGTLMQRHVVAFLAAALEGRRHGIDFAAEAHRRRVWGAIGEATRERATVDVAR